MRPSEWIRGNALGLVAIFIALGGSAYGAGHLGTADIENEAVTTRKLADAAVTPPKLRDNAVNQAKIRQGAVGELVPTGLEVTSSAFGIADDVATSGFGTEPPGTRIETTADQLAIDLAKRYSRLVSSLDQVGDLLVSDWGSSRRPTWRPRVPG